MATVKLPLGLAENGTVNTPSILTIYTSGNAGVAANPILDGRYRYSTALVQNVGSEDMYIRVGGTATTSVYHTRLSPMSQAEISDASYVDVTACIVGTSAASAVVFSVQVNDSQSQGATSYGT